MRCASNSIIPSAVMPALAAATSSNPGSSMCRRVSGKEFTSRASATPHTRENIARVSGRPGSASSTSAPASTRNCAACSTAAMLSQSTGASKPGRRSTATRSPATPSSMPSRQSRGSSGRQNGSRRSKRASAFSISALSRTPRVIGPITATCAKAPSGHCGTRPKLGFRPTTPHQAAGMRTEPPASVPICSGPNPAAAAAPAPEEEPPGVWWTFHGLRVMPCSGQSPGDFQPNSVVVVLPMITAPSAFSPVTLGASSAAGPGSVSRLPRRVGRPATSTRSFTVTGTPSRLPIGRPTRQRASLSPAAASAPGFITAKALIAGLSRATRSVTACSTSTGDRARRA